MPSRLRKIPFILTFALVLAALTLPAGQASSAPAGGGQSPSPAKPKPPRERDLSAASVAQKGRSLVLVIDSRKPINLSRLNRLPGGKPNADRYLCLQLSPGPGRGLRRICFGGPMRANGKLGFTVANAAGKPLRTMEIAARLKRPAPTRIVATLTIPDRGLAPAVYEWRVIGRFCEPGVRNCAESLPTKAGRIEIREVVPVGCTTGSAGLVTNGPRNEKVVALTFDDGPGTYTPGFLNVLREKKVKATFFVLGQMAAAYPEYARRIVREGHEIANHSWKHDLYPSYSDLRQTSDTIKSITGFRPCSFRPPGGARNSAVIAGAGEAGMKTIIWDVDPFDWRLPGTSAIRSIVLGNVRPGSIVLSHDAGGPRQQTLDALPGIIDGLRARGYRFVTVTEILGGKILYRMS